jgi:integrase
MARLIGHCARCAAKPPEGRDGRHYRRIWIALQLAYRTGLRRAELSAARFGDIVHKSRGGGQFWPRVLGKGGKLREVPLPGALADELKAYARARGVAWGVPDPPAPLVGKFRRAAADGESGLDFVETPFTPAGLHTVLKGFFNEVATAREAIAVLLLVNENLGHASLSTTSAYLHGDKNQRHEAMERLFRDSKTK